MINWTFPTIGHLAKERRRTVPAPAVSNSGNPVEWIKKFAMGNLSCFVVHSKMQVFKKSKPYIFTRLKNKTSAHLVLKKLS